jgi:predicted nuclease with TOPRIM domain
MNPTDIPANGAATEARERELVAENERLRAALQEADTRIRNLEQERDKYLEMTRALIKLHPEWSEWPDFNPAHFTISADAVMNELRALERG